MQPWVRRGVLDRTTRRQPPKSEIRGRKLERKPNTEGRSHARAFRISGFGLLSALGFRASGLGLCAHGLVVLSSPRTFNLAILSSFAMLRLVQLTLCTVSQTMGYSK